MQVYRLYFLFRLLKYPYFAQHFWGIGCLLFDSISPEMGWFVD